MRSPRPQQATLKVLIFPLESLYFALRLDAIRKVIPTPDIFKSGDKILGLAHFEDQEVMVLDLCGTVFRTSSHSAGSYLIVLQMMDQLYGITAPSLPLIKTVPLSDFHSVPTDYRTRDTLGVAEQMAQVDIQPGETVTIFLLEANQLLQLAVAS